jgi:hypothetical protein
MEIETETPKHLLYPYFELCNFYAARHLTERLAGKSARLLAQVHTHL